MSKRTVFTTISPLPHNISREVVIDFLHDYEEMIDLNPLVQERHPIEPPSHAPSDELHCLWYSLTDKISYLPGGLGAGDVTYTCAFNPLPTGLQTHCYAPAGLNIRDKWTLNGSLPGEPVQPVELGIGAPVTGLYIREDVEMQCNVLMTSFVKKTLKKSHAALIERLKVRAQIATASEHNRRRPSPQASFNGSVSSLQSIPWSASTPRTPSTHLSHSPSHSSLYKTATPTPGLAATQHPARPPPYSPPYSPPVLSAYPSPPPSIAGSPAMSVQQCLHRQPDRQAYPSRLSQQQHVAYQHPAQVSPAQVPNAPSYSLAPTSGKPEPNMYPSPLRLWHGSTPSVAGRDVHEPVYWQAAQPQVGTMSRQSSFSSGHPEYPQMNPYSTDVRANPLAGVTPRQVPVSPPMGEMKATLSGPFIAELE